MQRYRKYFSPLLSRFQANITVPRAIVRSTRKTRSPSMSRVRSTRRKLTRSCRPHHRRPQRKLTNPNNSERTNGKGETKKKYELFLAKKYNRPPLAWSYRYSGQRCSVVFSTFHERSLGNPDDRMLEAIQTSFNNWIVPSLLFNTLSRIYFFIFKDHDDFVYWTKRSLSTKLTRRMSANGPGLIRHDVCYRLFHIVLSIKYGCSLK